MDAMDVLKDFRARKRANGLIVEAATDVVREFRQLQKSGKIEDKIYKR